MSKELDFLKISEVQAIVSRRVKERGLTARFEDDAHTAYTTETEVVIPTIKPPATKEDASLIYGMAIHECGHHARPRVFEILKNAKLPQGHPLGSLFNIIEDESMERQVGSSWYGDRKALGESFAIGIQRQLDKYSDEFSSQELDDMSAKGTACMVLQGRARRDWDEWSMNSMLKAESVMSDKIMDLCNTLTDEGWVERYKATNDEEDSWNLAIDLYKRLFEDDHDNEEEANEFNEAAERIREQGLNGSCDNDEAGEDGGSSDADRVAPSSNDDVGDATHKGYYEIPWDQLVISEHGQEEGGPCGVDWTGKTYDKDIGVCPPEFYRVHKCGERNASSYRVNNTKSREFSNQLRRYLMSYRKTRFKGEQYHGSLSSRELVRLGFPPIEQGDWNRRIFYQQTDRLLPDTAIGVLVDWSGSMSGAKMHYAADAAGRLNHVFTKLLRMPSYIAAFSYGYSGQCDIGIIKDWNERLTDERIARRFSWFEDYTGGNDDSDSLIWMARKLQRRKESRKIMVVLTDGMPTDSYRGCPHDNLKYAIKSASSICDVVGIGLGSNHVDLFYPISRAVDDERDINKALLGVLKDQVTKHGITKRRV